MRKWPMRAFQTKVSGYRLAVLSALILAFIGVYGLWRLSLENPRHWAIIIPYDRSAESSRLALDQALQSMAGKDGRLRAGARVPLASFVTSDGKTITIMAAEAQFYGRSIEPHNVWGNSGKDLLLVSSVDERMSATGGLAEPHAAGCDIPSEPSTIQALGEASIARCAGIYGQRFGVDHLARLSVIVDANPGSDNQPCWMKYGISLSENGYQDCVHKALASSLERLFGQLANDRYSFKGVIFPAVATGAGGLSKAAFYEELLQHALLNAIGRNGLSSMTIYLQVNRYDPPDTWLATRVAIASAIDMAASKWESSDHPPPSSEWLSLTGVALAGSIMLLAYAFGARHIAAFAGLGDGVGLTPILLTAWLAAAVGIASTFKAFVSLVPTFYGPYAQVAAGAIAAMLAGPLTRASEKVREDLKKPPAIDGEGDRHASVP